MKENDWTNEISKMLKEHDLGENIYVDTFVKIPYAFEIKTFTAEWGVDEFDKTLFETDMLVYEKANDRIIPRVIIESKVDSITTHDAITYSHKASYHKNVIPFIRYGIMCGNREHYYLPGRLFRHGTNFDFLFSFVGYEPTKEETDAFVEMIKKEIKFSKQMEEILSNSRNRNRKKYFMLQKSFDLREID